MQQAKMWRNKENKKRGRGGRCSTDTEQAAAVSQLRAGAAVDSWETRKAGVRGETGPLLPGGEGSVKSSHTRPQRRINPRARAAFHSIPFTSPSCKKSAGKHHTPRKNHTLSQRGLWERSPAARTEWPCCDIAEPRPMREGQGRRSSETQHVPIVSAMVHLH
ncbi:hypothetical protein SKAU_G00074350 [Synaphobranchus kaupii]|uniref:Uncharacterized protein n=1 Tax=Synaphobranchus kaupii TaxID=118154 RepID=A0A9Q1G7J3_SYNKA|nr:hypothetical protein SKAU_G00074350 [Synaphobranchus kaupii]